ncbi:unnamed protein product [Linum trigynum]|uniref:Endonuclease/exonuclease/phosphatase domain-containing protein n=1 Tax=Linum trigynum TaxID=586398 RepID=A0AAV2E378_9ROSI
MVNVFAWNCRGAAVPNFLLYFREFNRIHHPNLVFITEPKISGSEAEGVIHKMGFDSNRRVEAQGFAGGIWALWNSNELTLCGEYGTDQLLHLHFRLTSGEECVISCIYGLPQLSTRRGLWETMRRLVSQMDLPWLLIGDFNAMLGPEDKQGGRGFNMAPSREFREAVEDCSLLEIDYCGPRFTWHGVQGLKERQDRAVCNALWLQRYPDTMTRHL